MVQVIEGLHLFIKLITVDGGKAVSEAHEDEVIDDRCNPETRNPKP